MDKIQLRRQMIQLRYQMSDSQFNDYNSLIISHLENMDAFKKASHIAIYMSYKNEADTRNIISKYLDIKNFYIPRVEHNDLHFYPIQSLNDVHKGYFGIDEPNSVQEISKEDLDLMIVPLLLFDKNHYRIGYGKGFYDCYLKSVHCLKIGLAYSYQEIENTLPHDSDIKLDSIITENGLL